MDKGYHESRIKYHEERLKYHEERLRYHRSMVAKKEKNSGIEASVTKEALAAGRKVRILFVDLSNTCRSPAAEQTMKTLLKNDGLSSYFEVSSCSTGSGTNNWFKPEVSSNIEVEASDPRMVSHASRRGLNLAGRQSKVMTKEDLQRADLVVIMDNANRVEVQAAASYWGLRGSVDDKVKRLTEYCRSGTMTTDIPDPYYGGRGMQPSGQVFEKVLDLIEDGCKGLLQDCMVGGLDRISAAK